MGTFTQWRQKQSPLYSWDMQPSQSRVVIVEDQTIFRELLAEVLQGAGGLSIVDQFSEGRAAIERCPQLHPNLVILDVVLPDINGLDVLTQLLSWRPNLAVLMVTAHARPSLIRQAIQRGARGFVTKSTPLSELRTAVVRILAGGRYFCSVTSPMLVDALKEPEQGECLSQRQREVVQMIARGCSSKEIANELGISSKTVANHRAHIRERLGLGDIASITRYAIEQGLVEPKV